MPRRSPTLTRTAPWSSWVLLSSFLFSLLLCSLFFSVLPFNPFLFPEFISLLDFSSQTVGAYGKNGTIEILSIVIMTSKQLQIDIKLFPDAFSTKDGVHIPFHVDLRKKATPRVIRRRAQRGTGKPKSKNIRKENEKRPNFLPLDNVAPKVMDRPFIYYFDILAEKGNDKVEGVPGQNSAYVKQGLEMILRSGLFGSNKISKLAIWSDGYNSPSLSLLIILSLQ